MTNIEILKTALAKGVEVLPKNFLEENNIKAKYLGVIDKLSRYTDYANVYLIEEEDDELNDKVVYEEA